MTNIFAVNSKHFGEVEFEGIRYALTEQAEQTNRAFPGGWHDASEGDEYLLEYGAHAINETEDKFFVTWMFSEIKGSETEDASNYDWSVVSRVVES